MRNLDPATHELHVACATGPAGDPTPTYEAVRGIRGVRIRPVNFGVERSSRSGLARTWASVAAVWSVTDLLSLALYIRRNRIAIVHTSDRPRDAVACVLLGRLTGATSVVHVHTGFADWMSAPLRWALRQADVRIAISSFVEGTLLNSGHAADSTHVVLNGIDTSAWVPRAGRQDARRELGLPDETPVIFSASRLFPSKGPAELIKALGTVRDRHPDVQLLIAGKEMVPGFASELTRLARDLGVDGNVKLLGYRPDIGRLMAAADIFAMPSIGEPFGLVYVEAMAMELPVVALESGGAPEVVSHGVTGLLSAPADVVGLANNLSDLLSDPERRARMGRAGRHRVETAFTSGRMADDVAAVYHHILPCADFHEIKGATVGSLSLDLAGVPDALRDDGFVVLRNVVAKDRLALLADELADAYARADKLKGGGSIAGHINCFPGRSARFIYEELVDRGIVDAVHRMRADRDNAVRSTMNYNLPGSVAQHYHIDGLYTDDFMICNVAVIDTTLHNGAIDLLPGTNREFLPFWKYSLRRSYRLSTRIEMNQGDVLLRRSNLWHRGMPNNSSEPRPMLSITFGEKSAPQADPFDGDISFYPNWYKSSRLGIVRERVFVAAPISYSAFRFVKSLHGNKGYSSY
jgi:glycosyltransferase involved in cell wall biosynthesis